MDYQVLEFIEIIKTKTRKVYDNGQNVSFSKITWGDIFAILEEIEGEVINKLISS